MPITLICPNCDHELSRHEVALLYGKLGGLATAKKIANKSVTSGRPGGVLTQKDVEHIRKSKKPIKKLAEKYEVNYLTVWRVKNNKTWRQTTKCPHCNEELTKQEIGVLFGALGGSATTVIKTKSSAANGRKNSKLTQADANRIRKSKATITELAREYKVSYHAIWLIKNNRTWKQP